jgi:hypothetical protein
LTVLPEYEIDHSEDLREAFKNFDQENSERDTQILVGENKKIISVHSFFISMRSQKLFQMIKNNPTLELLDENENLFSELINYAYTGEANISPKETYDFLQLRFDCILIIQSIKYGFDGVLEGLLNHIDELNSETVVKMYLDYSNYQSIKEKLKKVIEKRAADIFDTKLLYMFSKENLEEIVKDWSLGKKKNLF